MSTHERGSRRRLTWRGWMAQCALLCLLALHAAGLLHVHCTAADQSACAACQVADNHALDLPDPGTASLLLLPVLLFLIVLRHRSVVPGPELFLLPHSRAPPAIS
jgi:hypothetical protein